MSLGVDLVPSKVCSLNCVYCECGATTRLTLERREYVPAAAVIDELRIALTDADRLDYVTFSGAGEPTLHSGIGEVVAFLKSNYPDVKLCLLTNATLLGDADVIAAVKDVDLVIPSLDAVVEDDFRRINRPAEGLTVGKIIDNIRAFRQASAATIWLEIFVVPEVTVRPETIPLFVRAVQDVKPDKVQINTLDRPGCVDWIRPAAATEIAPLVEALSPFATVEVTGKFKKTNAAAAMKPKDLEKDILQLASRRPMTQADLAASLSVEGNALDEALNQLEATDRLAVDFSERGKFYRTKENGED